MTPYEIQVLLHYSYSPGDHADMSNNPPIWRSTMQAFVNAGLLQQWSGTRPIPDTHYSITRHGRTVVERLCQISMLVCTGVQPEYVATEEQFLAEVRAEVSRARSKFPSRELMTLALAEEFGEVCKAVLDEPAANVRRESVQLAAMACRVAIEGDGSAQEWRRRKGLDRIGEDAAR